MLKASIYINQESGQVYLDVSKNRDTPKWMVYKWKPYEQIHDLGVQIFVETPIWCHVHSRIEQIYCRNNLPFLPDSWFSEKWVYLQ